MKNPYRTLGVENCVSMEEVKRAYRRLALANHPDRGGDQEKMKAINEAYSFLQTNKAELDIRLGVPRDVFGFTIIVGGWNRADTSGSNVSATFTI